MTRRQHVILIDGGGLPSARSYRETLAKAAGLTPFDTTDQLNAMRGRRDELAAYVRDNPEWVQLRPLVFGALQAAVAERRKPGGFLVTGGVPQTAQEADWLAEVFRGHEIVFVQVGEDEGSLLDPAVRALLSAGDFYHVIGALDGEDPRFLARFLTTEPVPFRAAFDNYRRQYDNGFLFLPTPPFSQRHVLVSFAAPARAEDSARAVQLSLEWSQSARKWRQFCGTHPVSLTRENMQTHLRRDDYVVSAKLDGTRYFLLLWASTMWFIDRNTHVWQGPRNARLLAPYHGALLDVELCEAVAPHTAPTLCVIDVVAWGTRSVREWPLARRLQCAEAFIRFLQGCPAVRTLFHVQPQEYYPADAAHACIRRFVDAQRAEEAGGAPTPYDGLVFTPARGAYVLGRSFALLKWKPPHKNTVDLQLRPRRPTDNPFEVRVLYSVDHGLDDAGTVVGLPSADDEPALYELESPIVECCAECIAPLGFDTVAQTPCRAVWRYVRLRPDKSEPNVHWVVARIVDTLAECITCDELTRKPPPNRFRVKKRRK